VWGHKKQTNSTWSNQRGLRQGKDLSVSQDYGELNQGKSSSYPVGRGIIIDVSLNTIFILSNLRGSSPLLWPWWLSFSKIIFQPLAGVIMKIKHGNYQVLTQWFHSQNRSSPLKVVKHIDNSIIGTCYPSLNSAYILLIFASHLFGVFLFIYFWLHTNPRWNLCPLQWKHGRLTTGPPGKSSHLFGFTMTK